MDWRSSSKETGSSLKAELKKNGATSPMTIWTALTAVVINWRE